MTNVPPMAKPAVQAIARTSAPQPGPRRGLCVSRRVGVGPAGTPARVSPSAEASDKRAEQNQEYTLLHFQKWQELLQGAAQFRAASAQTRCPRARPIAGRVLARQVESAHHLEEWFLLDS